MSLEGEGGRGRREILRREGGEGMEGGWEREGGRGGREGRGDCYTYSNIIQWHQSI